MADIKYIITADAKGVVKEIKAVDDSVDGMAKQAKKSVSPLKGMWKQMAAGIGITSLITAGLQAVKRQVSDMITKGVEFGREWANVTTMLSTTQEETDNLRTELKNLSPTLGDTTELARAMYQVLSASVEPAEAIEFLGVAAKAAKAGITEAEVAVDALTSVINAYGLETESATKISDIMFQTVKMGKLTYDEMATSLGTIVPVASQVGIGFDEVGAAMATMTKQGIDANTATMQLRQILMSTLAPSKDAQDAAKELGIQFDAAALKSKGLAKFIDDLMIATDGNNELLVKFIPNVRALTGVMALGGEAADDFADGLETIRTESGQTEEAFRKQMESAGFWIDATKTSIDKLKIAFIEGFTKPILEGIESSEELDETIKDLIDKTETFGEALGTLSKYGLTPFLTQLDLAIERLQAVNFAKGGSLWSLAQTIVMENIPAFKELEDAIFQADERALAGFNAGIEFGEGILKDFNKAVEAAKKWIKEAGVESETTSTKIAKLPVPLALTKFEVQKLQREWKNLVDIWVDNSFVIEDQELALELLKIEAIDLGDTLKEVLPWIQTEFETTGETIKTVVTDAQRNLEALSMDLSRSFGDAFESILTKGTDFEDALNILFDGLVGSIRGYLGQMVTDFLANNVFSEMASAATAATSSVTGTVGSLVGGAAEVSKSAAGAISGIWTGLGAAVGTLIAGLITGGAIPKSSQEHLRLIHQNTTNINDVLRIDMRDGQFNQMLSHLGESQKHLFALQERADVRNRLLTNIDKNLSGSVSAQGGFYSPSLPSDTTIRAHKGEAVSISRSRGSSNLWNNTKYGQQKIHERSIVKR